MNARGPSWLQTGRNELIGFEVVGRAVPYVRMTQREAAMAKGGAGRKTRQINRYWDWKSLVGWEATKARVRMLPKDRLVTVRCRFFVTRPLPDCDNLVKGVIDALNGVAYEDDKQVREEYGAMIVVRNRGAQKASVWVGELKDKERWEVGSGGM